MLFKKRQKFNMAAIRIESMLLRIALLAALSATKNSFLQDEALLR